MPRRPRKRTPLASFNEDDKAGYYKAFHDVTAYMPLLSGNAWKVLCYVLRHTLGFQEWEPKRITLDEFCKGRKLRNRTRMDTGTGLAEHAVIRAIKECIAVDVLYVEVDGHDQGRIQKRYAVIAPNHPYYGVVAAEEGKPGIRLIGGVYYLDEWKVQQQRAFLADEEEKRKAAPKTTRKKGPFDDCPSASPLPFCCYDPGWPNKKK